MVDGRSDERDLRRLLAGRGVSPGDGEALLALAAVGLARRVWHAGPAGTWLATEDAAAAGDVLRIDVDATKVVRFTLATDGYDLESVFHALTDDRPLPVGERLRDLAGERWQPFADHAARVLGGLMEDVDEGGVERSVLRVAACAAVECPHCWGTPWWPEVAEQVALVLADPSARRRRRAGADATPPSRPLTLTDARLTQLLLAGPDLLDRDEAAWLVPHVAGPDCHLAGYARWRAGRTADATAPVSLWALRPHPRDGDPCPCGSGLPAGRCHGRSR